MKAQRLSRLDERPRMHAVWQVCSCFGKVVSVLPAELFKSSSRSRIRIRIQKQKRQQGPRTRHRLMFRASLGDMSGFPRKGGE